MTDPAAEAGRAQATEAVLAALPDGVLVVDPGGIVTLANPAAEELWGLSGLAGRPLDALGPAGRVLAARLARGGGLAALLELGPGPAEARIAPFDGGLVVVLRAPGALAALTRGDLDLARVTELAAGLAHEVRNPLAGIKGAADLLAREVGASSLTPYAEVIAREAARVEDLVRGLLELARPHPMRLAPVNLHAVVDEVLLLTGTTLPPGVTVARRFDPSLPELRLDARALRQALLNVVQNAVEALTPEGGTLTLSTGLALGLATRSGPRQRTMARLVVSDEGPGFPQAVLEKPFTPFLTTRARGTGLGLALSRRLVEAQGGLMTLGNRPGGGAQVTLLLPVV